MNFVLPNKFEDILKGTKYHGEILTIFDKFSAWIKDNKLEFFPEYTDHGIDHIQSVINTSQQIITEKSWNILTPEDIYVIISAILLHDCAMHLDKNGLWALLTHDKFNGATLGKLEQGTWKTKWDEFQIQIKRFEEKDWINFFGKFETVTLPEIGDTNLNDQQKIIMGDFIRQHHGDIAEIIATYGIPCKNENNSYEIFSSHLTSLNQLAGFIAKSHNYHLRTMIDQLGGEQAARNYYNTHPAYLMAVLRIADYLQFTQARTPKILFKIRGTGMCSPISFMEWKTHLEILHAHQDHSDNELLFVDAQPEEAYTLEKMKTLFSNIQYQLDSCWAVIGEIYSRYDSLSNFGLKIRRIKSNIDSTQEYIKINNKKFHPEILKIKSDNEKILPLLVAPLYGDFPQIGVRELLQNSIDACNERYSAEKKSNITNEDIPYKVEVSINLDNNTFIIQDNGIGMDIDVIKNYFLKIGASYRYSEVWKATHSDGNNTYVPRTGKFGIGMLAGFLIGNEIEITTKKATMPNSKAINFVYNLNQQNIQVNFVYSEEIGTKITIKSDNERLEKIVNNFDYVKHNSLMSFWYFLDTPVIKTSIIKNNETRIIDNKNLLQKKDIFTNWNHVQDSDLQGFYWRSKEKSYYYSDHEILYCNGIAIRTKNDILPKFEIDSGWEKVLLELYDICIFDNLGQFPLNLTRDNLISNEFFEIEKLRTNVLGFFYSHLKKLLINFTYSQESIYQFLMPFRKLLHNNMLPFIFFDNKIIPIGNPELINKDIFIDFTYDSQKRGILYDNTVFPLIRDFGYTCIYDSLKEVATIRLAIKYFLLNEYIPEISSYYFPLDNIYGRERTKKLSLTFEGYLYIKNYDFNKLQSNEKSFLTQENIEIAPINNDWSIIRKTSHLSNISLVGHEIIKSKTLNSFIFVIGKITNVDKTEFSELWEQYQIGN